MPPKQPLIWKKTKRQYRRTRLRWASLTRSRWRSKLPLATKWVLKLRRVWLRLLLNWEISRKNLTKKNPCARKLKQRLSRTPAMSNSFKGRYLNFNKLFRSTNRSLVLLHLLASVSFRSRSRSSIPNTNNKSLSIRLSQVNSWFKRRLSLMKGT